MTTQIKLVQAVCLRVLSRGGAADLFELGLPAQKEGRIERGYITRCDADRDMGKLQAMWQEPTSIRKLLRAVQMSQANQSGSRYA